MNDQSTTVAQLRRLVAEFVTQRDWEQFHDPKNISTALAVEAAELMEHFQWLRSDQLEEACADAKQREGITEEVADVLAFVLAFANRMEIDLSSALASKMKKNALKYPAEEFRGRFK